MAPPSPASLPTLSSTTSTAAIVFSAILSILFVLKGNTFNIECVGCMYEPTSTRPVPVVAATKPVNTGDYDCNVIAPLPFRDPPKTPNIVPDLTRSNYSKVVPVLTDYATAQRQYIYDYQKHVNGLVAKHNRLCK